LPQHLANEVGGDGSGFLGRDRLHCPAWRPAPGSDVEHQGAKLGVAGIVAENLNAGFEGAQELLVVQLQVGDADDAPAKRAPLLLTQSLVLDDSPSVSSRWRLQSGKQNLERDIAFEKGGEVVKNDDAVWMLGQKLKEAHRRQVPALVDEWLQRHFVQDAPDGV